MSKIIDGKRKEIIISVPEITQISEKNLDFIIICSDGITKVVDNIQIVKLVWETSNYYREKGIPFD